MKPHHQSKTLVALAVIANLPWSLVGMVGALLSGPISVRFSKNPPAVIIRAKSLWWLDRVPGHKGVRAAAWGNVAVEGPKLLPNDDKHELIHIEQAMRHPFIHPILYAVESIKHGHKNNRYEREAYRRASNKYLG